MNFKSFAKNICPPIFWEYAKYFKAAHASITDKEKVIRLKQIFDESNRNYPANRIKFRENIDLRLHPDSRIPFEYFCFRSVDCVEEMDAFLKHTKQCKHLLDIGALHGVFTLAFAASGENRRALAIDASPLAFAKLLYNIHVNALQGVVALECAVSDGQGSIKMHYENEHMVAAGVSSSNAYDIPAQTGNELCKRENFSPDVIKIDVEGHECKVIRGLSEVISSYKPMVFLELHPNRILEEGESISEIRNTFCRLDYHVREIDFTEISWDDFVSHQQDHRFILTPS